MAPIFGAVSGRGLMQEAQAVAGDAGEAQGLLAPERRLHGEGRRFAQAFGAMAVGQHDAGLRRQLVERKRLSSIHRS